MTPARGDGRSWVGGLSAAVGFLTMLPVPEAHAARGRARATAFFPFVGALLGLVTVGILGLPLDPAVGAALAILVVFLLTGGLHWDAWGDVLDATVTPGLPRARRIEILRDSRAGVHAVVGIALIVVVAVWALGRAPAYGVVVGSALARWAMVATLRWCPPLIAEGAASRMRPEASPLGGLLILASVVVGALALGADPTTLGWIVFCGTGVATAVAALLVLRLGGLNGDGHGAVGLVAEVATWTAAAHLGPGAP